MVGRLHLRRDGQHASLVPGPERGRLAQADLQGRRDSQLADLARRRGPSAVEELEGSGVRRLRGGAAEQGGSSSRQIGTRPVGGTSALT
jgi:hypothetical protein